MKRGVNMPLPLIVGAIAVVAGATGVAKGVSGEKKIKEAKIQSKYAKRTRKSNTIINGCSWE